MVTLPNLTSLFRDDFCGGDLDNNHSSPWDIYMLEVEQIMSVWALTLKS